MNKNLEYYLGLPYRMEIVEDPYEGGFVAYFPELPGCVTCSQTAEGVVENALDAKRVWLEAAIEDEVKISEPIGHDDYSGKFVLRVPKTLHRSLVEHSSEEGISLNQYCVYLLSKFDQAYV